MNADRLLATQVLLVALLAAAPAFADDPPADPAALARGRYLVLIGGCNDCHTPGYAEAGGKAPEAKWLTGVPVGFAGPWGVSYPANLRLNVQSMGEDQWLARARSQLLPPMPWFSLGYMKDDDVRAIYRFIKSLGPAGEPAPAFVPPGGEVKTPVMDFYPHSYAGHLAEHTDASAP